MIVFFDLQPEYRRKLADILEADEEELDGFFGALESEVAWHLAFDGLRESELADEQILEHIRIVNSASRALREALADMPRDVYGWLIDHAPVGIDYQMPFRVVQKPVKLIESMTAKAAANFKPRQERASRSTSVDLIRKIAAVCEKSFGRKPDMASKLFHDIVNTVFEALGVSGLRNTEKLIAEASGPLQRRSAPGDDRPGQRATISARYVAASGNNG
jgi:hypothetical protein